MSFDPIAMALCSAGGGSGLPYVELETPIPIDGETGLSEADIAKLSTAMETKMPVVIRFIVDSIDSGTICCSVFDYVENDSMRRLSTSMDGVELVIVNLNGQWVCGVPF